MPRAAVVGVGRSGTGYTATMLNSAGIQCGHESWWNPLEEKVDVLVDSSWMALPDLMSGRFDGVVVVQHRHPVRIANSLAVQPEWGPYREFTGGLVELTGSPEEDAVRKVEFWTRAMMDLSPDAVWYLEDQPGEREAGELASLMGVGYKCPEKIGRVNTHVNTLAKFNGGQTARLIDLAKEIGY